ncbi:histidine phosphatase family protein [uncultured Lactobacillus sp.]|uniref:histidine phosphatase family protein n=1 Tax=uncultured Lactobacillus sp. TaxID=153152 RepID=UPI002622B9AC|nr:histidine phosphatase family protein [uncultured Lactobacillus sp.]
MKTIYLVRHGETLFNVHHKIQGACDSPLTELGKKQAQLVHNYFKNKFIHFDAAFCSTQQRASDTLEIITQNKIQYSRIKNLCEKDHGQYEGQDEYMLPWRRGYSRSNPAFESDEHVTYRMICAMDEILSQTKEGEKILVVGHGTALRLFTKHINPEFSAYSNCEIVQMVAKNNVLTYQNCFTPALELVN